MAKQVPIPILGGYYADEALPWSAQDVCNWLPTQAESAGGTQTSGMLKTPPGLKPHIEIVDATAVRGTYNCEGKFFAVIGDTLYQISNTQVAIPIGTIPGLSRVQFAHNQIVNGNELLIVNGNSGYVYNTVTLTLTRITDSGYVGAINAVFIDGFLVQIEPKRRFAFNSAIASAMDYNTLDRFTSEASPDLLVTMAVSNNELVLMSETSTEFFYNSGAVNQPFRTKRISLQKGCASRYGAAVMDNTVYMFGNDGYFYRLDGYSWIRISNRPIEQMVRGLDWKNAFAFVWQDSGHSVCYWTFPAGFTIGYDASIGQWHRRASWGLNYWRPISMTFWNQEWYAGDSAEGKIWKLDWQYMLEGDDCFVSERVTQIVHDNMNRVGVPRLELLMDTGMPETVAVEFPIQPPMPTISGNAPNGFQDLAWGPYAYTIGGGTPPLTTSVLSGGHLPDGIGPLNNAGVIVAGTPTTVERQTFTVRVTDSNGLFADQPDTINILPQVWSVSDRTVDPDYEMVLTNDTQDANSTAAPIGTNVMGVRGHISHGTGRYYVEIEVIKNTTGDGYYGVRTLAGSLTSSFVAGSIGCDQSQNYNVDGINTVDVLHPTVDGTVIGVAIDFSSKRAWIHKDGVWLGAGGPSVLTGALNVDIPAGDLAPWFRSEDSTPANNTKAQLRIYEEDMEYFPVGAWAVFTAWGE